VMMFYCDRFQFISIHTISDVWFNGNQVLRLPINFILQIVDNLPEIRQFFEVTCTSGTGGGSLIFSIFLYLAIFVAIIDKN
jgi:hypothetical protein